MTHYIVSLLTRKSSGLILVALALLSLRGIAQFSDNFSDGDFTSNPTWSGSTSVFIVNASQQLQINDVAAGQSALYTTFPSTTLDNREWQVWVKQTFSGSDSNHSRIYLSANGAPTSYTGSAGTAGVQGYFLKLGEGGSADAIKLFRDDGTGNAVQIGAGTASLIASSFTIRIKVTRDNNGLWSVYADPAGGTSFAPEFTVIDQTYTSSTHFGFIGLYTSSNANKFFFDDGYFGLPILDTTAPLLLSATATSPTTLNVVFSEALNNASATNVSNYSVSGIGNPVSVVMNGTTAQLTFGSAFPENVLQTLTVSGITDLAGNLISPSPSTTTFTWLVAGTPEYRSVVFNEVMSDQSAIFGLPDAEYVELFNSSDQTFDLAGWKFVNSTTVKTLPSKVLAPGDYVILCEDDFAGDFANSIGISSFTALTNNGDSLTLLDATDQIIDILVYSLGWYDGSSADGISLEQINPFLACQNTANWKPSLDEQGGTPAEQNSIYDDTPDTQAPVISSYETVGFNKIILRFPEAMDAESFLDAVFDMGDFEFSGFNWNTDVTSLTLDVSPDMAAGVPYVLTVSGLKDCSGNDLVEVDLDILIGNAAEPGDLVINEIMPDPDAAFPLGPQAEYIEIFNKSEQLIDLKNCTLNDEPFIGQTLIQPGGFLIVADESNATAFLAFPGSVFLEGFPGLTNSGATLTLRSAEGGLIDEVAYSDSWYAPGRVGNGYSLELINPFDPCSDLNNWTSSSDARGMTAGEQNSVYDITPDTQAPSFILVLNEPTGFISLQFSEPLDPNSLGDLTWSIDGVGLDPELAIINPAKPNNLVLPIDNVLPGTLHYVTVSGIADCWGNAIGSLNASFGVPETAQPGDLIINEILADPNSPGQDFVEIYNNSSRAISLKNWYLASEEGGVPANSKIITDLSFVLLPGQYLVLTETGHNLPAYYPYTRTEAVWIMADLPSFNIDAGVCYLITPDVVVSDKLVYTSDMHFPLLKNKKGVSIERIDFNRPSDDVTNWLSAAESQGFATPGYLNSQAFSAGISEEQITLEPEIFSPDNDGYQDVLTISYTTEEPALTGNITIYSQDGIRVRRLMRNQLLGREGQISWNGTGDEGQALSMGIYVVYFEAFNPDGKVSHIKKPCVLAHQLGGGN